jgi:hypothetical protein
MSDPVSHVQKTANDLSGNKNSDNSEADKQLQSLSLNIITNANRLKTITEFTEL